MFLEPHLNPLQPRAALALAVAQGENFDNPFFFFSPSPLEKGWDEAVPVANPELLLIKYLKVQIFFLKNDRAHLR